MAAQQQICLYHGSQGISSEKERVMEVRQDPGGSTDSSTERPVYGVVCHEFAMLLQKIMEFAPVFEALQPPKSGMQALCGLHWAVDKAKLFLQRTVDSSKLYLAITGNSVASKFDRVKETLDQSLRRLELNVPDHLAGQIRIFIRDLQGLVFKPDASDQEAGNDIILLLQKEKEVPGINASRELDVFDRVVTKLGIKSSRALLAEKRALRRLLEKTRKEEDKKKELIVLYMLHLLRRYTRELNLASGEEGSMVVMEATSSGPPSPSDRGSEASTSGRDSDFSAELCDFRAVAAATKECIRQSFAPPEEFRCPISLQLMSDPVIISSGQTYERVCIEKWFADGHDTCPKTQQKLAHLDLTPNYCVKALIVSWCERRAIPIPAPPSPPPSLAAAAAAVPGWSCRRFSLSSLPLSPDRAPRRRDALRRMLSGSASNGRQESSTVPRFDGGSVEAPNYESSVAATAIDESSVAVTDDSTTGDSYSSLQRRVSTMNVGGCPPRSSIKESVLLLSSSSLAMRRRGAEEIRFLTRDDADARTYVGESGSIPALVSFLDAAIKSEDENAQETACFALLNVAINNNRNKAEIVDVGALSLLLQVLGAGNPLHLREAAVAVLLTTSCLEENKLAIGLSGAVRFLVNHLDAGSPQGVKDALTALFNLSIFPGNHRCMLHDGAIPKLFHLLGLGDTELTEKCIAILYNLASMEDARSKIVETDGGISTLAEFLDSGSPKEKDLIASIFLAICSNNREHSQAVLREGVIPSLVMLSVNGSSRGKEKALKLLQHFREERQRDVMLNASAQTHGHTDPFHGKDARGKPDRGFFRRRTFSFFRRSKSFSFYHC